MNDAATYWWREDRLRAEFRAHFAKFYDDPKEPAAAKELDHRVELWLRSFHRREEGPAFLYELGRKTVAAMKDLPSWLDLSQEKRNRIIWSGLFPPKPDDLFAPPLHVEMRPESVKRGSDWTDPMEFSVRLSDNDGTIVEAFKRWLRVQRAVRQVPNPKPNTGKRRRPLSWQYVEVFHSPSVPGDTTSPSIKSKAKKLAAKYITQEVIDLLLSG